MFAPYSITANLDFECFTYFFENENNLHYQTRCQRISFKCNKENWHCKIRITAIIKILSVLSCICALVTFLFQNY